MWHRPELNFDAAFNAVDAEVDALPNPRHVRAWKPLTQWQLRDKAVKMNNKAAGPDGWLGSEIEPLPPEAFIPFADFCTLCENANKRPNDWRCASQVHLLQRPSPRQCPGRNWATSSNSLFSLVRLRAASRLQCSDCQTWLSSWWPHRRVSVPACHKVTRGHFLPWLPCCVQPCGRSTEHAHRSLSATLWMIDLGPPPRSPRLWMVFSIWGNNAQFYHAQAAGRRTLCRHEIPAANVTDQICILGHIFRPLQQKSLNAKEKERVSSTMALIRGAACLPLPMCHKRLVISVGPLSKVQFGWLMHVPPIAICDNLQIATRKALNEPKRSCIFLRDILRGHNLHVGFRMLQTCVSAVFRFFQRCPLPAWIKLVSQVPYQPNSPVLGG